MYVVKDILCDVKSMTWLCLLYALCCADLAALLFQTLCIAYCPAGSWRVDSLLMIRLRSILLVLR